MIENITRWLCGFVIHFLVVAVIAASAVAICAVFELEPNPDEVICTEIEK